MANDTNNIWSKFDKEIDTKALASEIEGASTRTYREIPKGTYEVKVEKLELVQSKAGDPMVTAWFEILQGEYKGSFIFMNQVITQAFQVHIVNEFLRSLGTDLTIEFTTYSQYGNLLMDIHEAIDGNMEYVLNYGENNKGYSTFEIEEIFDVE